MSRLSLSKLVATVGLATGLLFATNVATANAAIKAGVDYKVLNQAVSPNKKVEMAMSFTCVHCEAFTNRYKVVDKIKAELKKYPGSEFIEYHITFDNNPLLELLARHRAVLYATKRDDLIAPSFKLIHTFKGDGQVFKDFLATNLKKSNAEIDKLWSSFSVNTFMKRQAEFTKKYNITQTPTFIVNGKYELILDSISTTVTDRPLTDDEVGQLVAQRVAEMLKLGGNGSAEATPAPAPATTQVADNEPAPAVSTSKFEYSPYNLTLPVQR